ncbi:hypothetical protein [Oceanimonas smirnovii]|uniref:Peptidase M15A C-terminal domain-containing protein n=1 Tax=Oceanimonas smirnovii TaxID=264574 RepID=A0ABW7P1U8_9GAMM
MQLTDACSNYFTFEMLFHCGETWRHVKCENEPLEASSWRAYQALAETVLDPLVKEFGEPKLTFGFCGHSLRRAILRTHKPGIAPSLDQHAACERNRTGRLVCPRLGAAVDLIYPSISSAHIAHWLASNTPFDRIYFYGNERPLHISHGPAQSRAMTHLIEQQGRRLPRALSLSTLQGWL